VLAVPPTGAVRDYLCGDSSHTQSWSIGRYTQVLPVMPSIFNEGFDERVTIVYRSVLVRLWRRIAVRINSAPSLNCVLVIANR
jgi:hypothetical protein